MIKFFLTWLRRHFSRVLKLEGTWKAGVAVQMRLLLPLGEDFNKAAQWVLGPTADRPTNTQCCKPAVNEIVGVGNSFYRGWARRYPW